MPHLSKRKVEKDTLKLIDSALIWTFSRLSGNEVNIIFNSLLTKTERIMLAKRLGILHLLSEEQTESVVAETLKTTQPTVSRIKMQQMLAPNRDSEFIFRKLARWQEFTAFKTAMGELAFYTLKKLSRGMAGRI